MVNGSGALYTWRWCLPDEKKQVATTEGPGEGLGLALVT